MDIKEYTRKPFGVRAVEVTVENAVEVAQWCAGSVERRPYKILGNSVQLPCVMVPLSGSKKGQMAKALLGHFVVEQDKSFRVYSPHAFQATFNRTPAKDGQYAMLDAEYAKGIIAAEKLTDVMIASLDGGGVEIDIANDKFSVNNAVLVTNEDHEFFDHAGVVIYVGDEMVEVQLHHPVNRIVKFDKSELSNV